MCDKREKKKHNDLLQIEADIVGSGFLYSDEESLCVWPHFHLTGKHNWKYGIPFIADNGGKPRY